MRGNLQNDNESGLPQLPGQPANSVTLRNNKGFAIGLTSVFRPTLINNFRYGLTRAGSETTGIANYGATTLRGLDPNVGITRGSSAIIPVHTFADDMNLIKGAHNIQFGGVIRLSQNQRNNLGSSFSDRSWQRLLASRQRCGIECTVAGHVHQ